MALPMVDISFGEGDAKEICEANDESNKDGYWENTSCYCTILILILIS